MYIKSENSLQKNEKKQNKTKPLNNKINNSQTQFNPQTFILRMFENSLLKKSHLSA